MDLPGFDKLHSRRLSAATAAGLRRLPVYDRAQLGESPDHEIVHVTAADILGRYHLSRGQEGTDAADWPAGTPFTWLRDASPDAPADVENLSASLSATATRVDLRHAYRRVKIDSEILWVTSVGGGNGQLLDVQRAQEGTTEATHAAGAAVTWLAAGES